MQVRQKITPSIIAAATGMLQPFIPELSPQTLMRALEGYRTDEAATMTAAAMDKPMTRRQAAEFLGVSLPTVNRLLNRGTLRRIYITRGAVRVAADSVKTLINGNAAAIPAEA